MSKRIVFYIFLGTLLLGASTAAAQTTYFSDGTSATTIGGTTYFSDGSTANTIGGTTYYNGPNGESGTASTIGGTTYYNGTNGDSWTANTIGGTTYYSGTDGTYGTANTIGGTTYYSGNIFNQCPANSSYNSLSDDCKCNYGYKSNGTSCVYSPAIISYPTTPTCPLDAYYSGSSCECDAGYVASGSICITATLSCQNQYGPDSYGSGSYCYCSAGYQFNTAKTYCTATPPADSSAEAKTASPTPAPVSTTPTTSCSTYGTGAELRGSLCYCSQNYEWNSALNSCIAGNPVFTKYSSLGSTGSEVVNLKNLLAIEGLYTGYVDTPFDSATATAVKTLQGILGISQTGTVGPLTRAALNKFINAGYQI